MEKQPWCPLRIVYAVAVTSNNPIPDRLRFHHKYTSVHTAGVCFIIPTTSTKIENPEIAGIQRRVNKKGEAGTKPFRPFFTSKTLD
jgi:hypothetical protein